MKRDGTRAETRFRLSPKRTSPFKSSGASVQPTAGSRGVRIRVSNTGYNMFRGRVRVLATHSILQFPLHFPSRASPCAIRFQTHSTYYECAAVFLPYVSGMQSPCSVLYCHLWPVWFYYIFTHYLIKGTIYVKKKKGTDTVYFDSL